MTRRASTARERFRIGDFVALSPRGRAHFRNGKQCVFGRVVGFGRSDDLLRVAHLGAKSRHTCGADLWNVCAVADVPAPLQAAEQSVRPFDHATSTTEAAPSLIKPDDAGAPHVYWRGEWVPCW